MNADARRGQLLLEESRELVVVLDAQGCVVAASRRARETLDELREGRPLPPGLLEGDDVVDVPYEIDGRRERLVYLRRPGDALAYEELRAGFTASVSHELRTPLARLLSRLETALLPGEDARVHVEQARADVEQVRELIDDVLFLSELESGRAVVSLGATPVLPILHDVVRELEEPAARAAVTVRVEGDPALELPVRPRMLRVIGHNLTENAIRYAGPGATFVLGVARQEDEVVLWGADDGVGVLERDVARLFERFYRADRARASRGTGLGLAIVKHVVTAAGGRVEARGARGHGLEVRCLFPFTGP